MALVKQKRRLLPKMDRSLHAIDADLLATLNALSTGALPWPLMLHGEPGTGKTCAALALADIVESAAYWTLEGFCDFVMQNESWQVEGELDRLSEKELVIIDELGERIKEGDLQYTALKKIADLRNSMAGRVAIYISNVPPHDLAGLYDDRVASRLLCGTVFELTGDDRRSSRR